jgi:hypothetical protein
MGSEIQRFEERYFPGATGDQAVYVAATINGTVRIRVRGEGGQIVWAELRVEDALNLHQAVRTKAQRAGMEVGLV